MGRNLIRYIYIFTINVNSLQNCFRISSLTLNGYRYECQKEDILTYVYLPALKQDSLTFFLHNLKLRARTTLVTKEHGKVILKGVLHGAQRRIRISKLSEYIQQYAFFHWKQLIVCQIYINTFPQFNKFYSQILKMRIKRF